MEVTKTVTNQRRTWEIVKVSKSNKNLKLQDAEFELVSDENEDLVYYGKSSNGTTDKGKILWYSDSSYGESKKISEDQILPGTYTLRETKAPQGYLLSTTTWKLTLGQNGSWISSERINDANITKSKNMVTMVTCYFENEVLYNLPSTGHTGIFNILMSGILLMFAGILIIYKMKGKEVLKNKKP